MTQHVGVGLEAQLGGFASSLDMRAKPAVVKGEPRSLVKTNGEAVRRSARSSSPRIGSQACPS